MSPPPCFGPTSSIALNTILILFRVQGAGFRVDGDGFKSQPEVGMRNAFEEWAAEMSSHLLTYSRLQHSVLRVQSARFRVRGAVFRVWG
jgi:hypothetical protein